MPQTPGLLHGERESFTGEYLWQRSGLGVAAQLVGPAGGGVVVVLPVGDDPTGLCLRPATIDVKAPVSDAGIERPDVAVAPRLAG